MSDRNVPPEELARIRVQQVIEDELARAGVELPAEQVQQITADFLAGEQGSDTDQMMALLELGQGRAGTPANQGFPGEATAGFRDDQGRPVPLFGKHADEIWLKQREGWDGYGWTKDKIRELGRNPEPRELSRGGRWANTWEANRSLLSGLLETPEAVRKSAERHGGNANAMSFGLAPAPSEESLRSSRLAGLLNDHDRIRSQTHGESGYIGALINPEYAVGGLTSAMAPFSNAFWSTAIDADPVTEEGYPEYEWGESPLGAMAVNAMRYVNKHYPTARIQQDTRDLARAVEPTLPQGTHPAVGNKQLADAASLDYPSFDEVYREKFGEYPSYALSSAAMLGNNLLDPTIAATPLASMATRGIGKALLSAGKAMTPRTTMANMALGELYRMAAKAHHPDVGGSVAAMKAVNDAMSRGSSQHLARLAGLPAGERAPSLAGNFMRGWGINLLKGTKWIRNTPFATALLREAGDEAPAEGAIGAAVAAYGPHTPHVKNWFSGGDARTDLYVQDPDTGEMRPQTDSEFADSMSERRAGANRIVPEGVRVQQAIKASRYPEPHRPEVSPMQRIGRMGAGGH